MISKELLSEVLGKRVETVVGKDTKDNRFYFAFYPHIYDSDIKEINIYELAHMCKKWATTHNFKIGANFAYGMKEGRARLEQYQEFDIYNVFGYKVGHTAKSDWFDANSEYEAIFLACEWILKQKENK